MNLEREKAKLGDMPWRWAKRCPWPPMCGNTASTLPVAPIAPNLSVITEKGSCNHPLGTIFSAMKPMFGLFWPSCGLKWPVLAIWVIWTN